MHFIDLYLEWLHEIESPTDFQTATALFTISAATERKVWVNWGIDTVYPNVYFIIVGPPGTRKSVVKFADTLLQHTDINMLPDKATLRGMWNEMELGHRFFQLEDGVDIKHCSWGLISEEWQFFIGDQDKEFLNNLNKLYDCRPKFRYITATQGRVALDNTYFTMLGAIQPDILATSLPKAAIGSGFTSRIVYIVCNKERLKRAFPIINPQYEKELIYQIQLINTAKGEMFFDDETKKQLITWYENGEFEKSVLRTHPYFSSYIDRMPTHAVKLSILMSLARSSGHGKIDYTIKRNDWIRALKWLNKLEKHMLEVYGSFGKNTLAFAISHVQKFIKSKKVCTLSEAVLEFWQNVSYQDMLKVVESLTAMKKIKMRDVPNGKELHWIGGKDDN